MNEKDVTKLVNEMIDSENGCSDYLKKECKRLLNSGGIDPENYGNDYTLPKILLYVALKNAAFQYKPFLDGSLKDAKNLEHF